MRHATDGVLRALADRELDSAEAATVERHVAECDRCRARAGQIADRARAFESLFAAEPGRAAPNVGAAFTRFEARRQPVAQSRSWGRLWPAVAAATMVVVLIASGPTRAAARKLLGMFRAKTVVAVPLEHEFVASGKGQLVGDLLAEQAAILLDEKPREASNRAQASEWAGFTVRLPAARSDTPRILRVEGARSFRLTVDARRVASFLDLAHHPGVTLPPDLDGAQARFEIARAVKAVYGECPDTPTAQADPSRLTSCLDLVQSPPTTVITQPDLDLRQIAEVGLRVSGMSPSEAAEFNRAIDWTSTAAIPLPRESSSYENVRVDGSTGVLVVGRQYANWPTRWSLIWVRDDRVYSLGGFGEPRRSLAIAESLQ